MRCRWRARAWALVPIRAGAALDPAPDLADPAAPTTVAAAPRGIFAFARGAGYRKMVLWTNDVLLAARAIYRDEGFVLVRCEPHESFGASLVGEFWEKPL